MNSYNRAAKFYDEFTCGFDYTDYLGQCLSEIKMPKGNLALDCGCGTGSLLSLLTKRGFDCTGVDISDEMLQKASEKESLKGTNFVCQDLSKLDLYGAYDFVFCSLDTVNHILNKQKLGAFFRRVSYFTEPGGVFIFDIKNESALISSAKTEFYESDGDFLIWEGYWKKPYVSYRLTCFSEKDGLYEKSQTEIEERHYKIPEIKVLMKKTTDLKAERIFNYKNERTVFIYRKNENG